MGGCGAVQYVHVRITSVFGRAYHKRFLLSRYQCLTQSFVFNRTGKTCT